MEWMRFFKVFLLNLLGAVVLGGAILGIFGLLLAGGEGFINGAIWGMVLGLLGGMSSTFAMLISGKYWSDFAGRYALWWVKQETEGEELSSQVAEDDAKWPVQR